MIVKQCKTRVFYIKIIRKYGCLWVRIEFYFSKKVRLFSQNDVLFLFYFLINPTMTTAVPAHSYATMKLEQLGRPTQFPSTLETYFQERTGRAIFPDSSPRTKTPARQCVVFHSLACYIRQAYVWRLVLRASCLSVLEVLGVSHLSVVGCTPHSRKSSRGDSCGRLTSLFTNKSFRIVPDSAVLPQIWSSSIPLQSPSFD